MWQFPFKNIKASKEPSEREARFALKKGSEKVLTINALKKTKLKR
jgi:hypothetical protein